MSTVTRKQAPRPAKPVARYRRGKAPKGAVELSDSDEEEQEVAENEDEEAEDLPLAAVEADEDEDEDEEEDGGRGLTSLPTGKAAGGKMNIALKDVDIKDGKVIVAGREESGRTAMEESEEEEDEDEDEEDEAGAKDGDEPDESSEYESSSEEEEPAKPMFRPVFVPKRGRITVQEREKEAEDTEEALEKKKQQEEERRKQSHDMVAESIKRELAEKEKEKETPDIDDTDGVNPEEEFEAWRLRELGRIKRDKEAEAARELEREEIERRRALPEAQRNKEDLEHAKATRDAKSKGKQAFLQKYWHKGAFHQDAEILKKHDYTEKTESTVDVSLLPKVMQVRDFGKRSRTKYTHLVDQDTTVGNGGFGGASFLNKPGGGPTGAFTDGCFNCGGPHLKKDCPNMSGPPGSGANKANGSGPTRTWGRDRDDRDRERDGRDGSRRERSPPRYNRERRDENDSGRRRDRGEESYRKDRDRDYHDRERRSDRYRSPGREGGERRSRRYSRSRSRSPRRDSERDSRRSYRHKDDRRPDHDRLADGDHRDKRVRTS